ncbi:MAG TPA: hypothetical protein VGK63_04760 [Candidatus Limnocylindrales bacterium]
MRAVVAIVAIALVVGGLLYVTRAMYERPTVARSCPVSPAPSVVACPEPYRP